MCDIVQVAMLFFICLIFYKMAARKIYNKEVIKNHLLDFLDLLKKGEVKGKQEFCKLRKIPVDEYAFWQGQCLFSDPLNEHFYAIENLIVHKRWTATFLLDKLNHMLTNLLDNENICMKNQLIEREPFSIETLANMVKRHICNPRVSEIAKKIDSVLECRLVLMSQKRAQTTGINCFVLKNKHKWQDKREIVQKTRTESIKMTVDFNKLTKEEKLKALGDRYLNQ